MKIRMQAILAYVTTKKTPSKSIEYKTKLIVSTLNKDSRLDAEVVVPSKRLSNFWRSLDMPLINCEMELDLSWSRYYIISEVSWTSRAVPDTDPVEFELETATNSTTFQINNAKFYVPVGTLSINDNIKFLQFLEEQT